MSLCGVYDLAVRSLRWRSVVLAVTTALLVAMTAAPSQAKARVGAPWVVAASPTSMTLDWSGHGSFRVYPSRVGGGEKRPVKASTSKATVTGLVPGTMYCFTVARSDGADRSRTFCHRTPTRAIDAAASPISVVTFNICSSVCSHWKQRRGAVLRRILEADADVVVLQERAASSTFLSSGLRQRGYTGVSASSDEQIFSRDARLDSIGRGRDSLDGIVRRAGTVAPWVTLFDRTSGLPYTFVSVHLMAGSSRKIQKHRARQTRALLDAMGRSEAEGPVIYAGDFNSSRARGSDLPRRELQRAGYVDAYDQAVSLSQSPVSSSNGFESAPRRDIRYGDHIDRIFVPSAFGVSDWAVVAPLRRGKNVRPIASDHHPVRATVWPG